MIQHRLIAVSLLALGMIPSMASAQLLPERLVPPQQFAIPSLPMTEQPAARRPAGADKLPAHLWLLPVGEFPGSPTALTSERLPADWKRPVVDVPMLAAESDPVRPASPRQLFAPSAFALAADPLKAHTLDRFPLSSDVPARAVDDPTSAVAHALITLAVPLATPNAAALLRLAVADPFEHLRAIRLATPPADSDAPDAARESPPRPQLSADVPKK
ncbi:MAG: hypothetical protein DWI21_15065 [Planctomycetota bacterium]|nr:MAG: hypothetical protein DWI21_15065 [Planctomycetota bacterium]